MNIFNHYAEYYDLLYSTKDYESEVNYVDGLIKKYSLSAKTILDLGCGTGSHDFHFARKGYSVYGIDMSQNMIAIARKKQQVQGLLNLEFVQGNIASLSLNKAFDTIVSLFHVMNYFTTNNDMESGFASVSRHLKSGAVFIFDFWYGPAVLSNLPKTGVKNLENSKIKVRRLVDPIMDVNRNLVHVNYEINVEEKSSSQVITFKETHTVRYFFIPEIELLFERLGMEIINFEEWLTSRSVGKDTFGVCLVARKK